jgi:hypothetical protein
MPCQGNAGGPDACMAHALIGEPYNRELYRISVYLTGEEYLGAKRTRRANQSFAPLARCLVLFEKIFLFFRNANQAMKSHPDPKEGRCATSSTRDGSRWTLMALLTKALEADGEVVWS